MIPKVEFVYSFIYDKLIIENYYKRKYDFNKHSKSVKRFIKSVEPKWRNIERKILVELSKISGLKWGEPKIKCYITTHHFFCPFSDPLTLGAFYYKNGNLRMANADYFIHTLTHELIHQLFIQQKNNKKFERAFWKIAGKYKKELWNARIHVLLHAIHKHILLGYFGEKVLRREIESTKHYKMAGYYEAWQIVEKDGYKNIISEFRKHLK